MNFGQNPYRRNAFDAFPLRKDETGIRNIRIAQSEGRAAWRDNRERVVTRDGGEWALSQAELNSLERTLTDPLSRLQVEQFVHQSHYFTEDPEVARAAGEVAAGLALTGAPPALLDRLGALLLRRVVGYLPDLMPPVLADDVPWPPPPPPAAVEWEPFDQTLLRDR